ncbi:MAG TPA: GNAT family N-acetyltransferase [Cellvibrio sp.]|nr:GNAT family N-acetyltransferase [Cellvibrio sp.]
MEIVTAEIQDCEEIIRLQRIAYEAEAQLYKDWTLPPLLQTVDSLQQELQSSIILKAVEGNKIVGSVRAKLVGDACHIGRLIVHPDFQGKGIGSKLLEHIEKHFRQANQFELFTGTKSEGNIRFYMRNGYTISKTQVLTENISLVYLVKIPKSSSF